MERIIKFSVPEYGKIFDCRMELKCNPYCICYQYNIDNKYGPYGFNTKKSAQFIKNVFGEVLSWDAEKYQLYKTSYRQGLNFYGNLDGILYLYEKSKSYQKATKKNELLKRYNKPIQPLPEKPLVLDISDEGVYKSAIINKLKETGISIFIGVSYAPEAGESLILFDENLTEKIKHVAYMIDIDFVEVHSIDDLKPW